MNNDQILNLANLLGFALFANIPLGYLRAGARKRSLAWFAYVHASIPFIVMMRIVFGFGWEFIPFTLLCAILGQLLGGRLHGRRQN
ncbi:MAG: hypothetical protein C0624_01730 [Desulfuromonas sp.]|nr:MAG: hypothetical protein C0624_01730 [Desulfuromonas sp.]